MSLLERGRGLLVVSSNTRWRWYHGVGGYLAVQASAFALSRLARHVQGKDNIPTEDESRSYYRAQNQPWFAPPAGLFGPAWAVNNASAIWALLRALNKPARAAGRSAFLGLQLASWLDFVMFGAATFTLRSPVNGFVLTAAYLAFTVASLYVALVRLRDPLLALALAPLCAWLLLATALSFRSAQWNRDPLYGVGPFEQPARDQVKPGFGIRQNDAR